MTGSGERPKPADGQFPAGVERAHDAAGRPAAGRPAADAPDAPDAADRPVAGTDPDRDALDCIALVELVTEYLEETLDPGQRGRLEQHLDECPGCSIYIEQMRQTIRALGRLRPRDVPSDALGPLLRAFRAYARAHEPGTPGSATG